VIFTSDNGGNMYDVADGTTPTNNDPLRSGKGNNYEGGTRIPLIVRWPGRIAPGSVNPSVVSTVDHYPAILEMTGQKLRPEDHKDGVSYVPALKRKPFDRGPTLCDFPHFVPATMNLPKISLRSGDWKLYRIWFDRSTSLTAGGAGLEHRYELYNLKDDIGETRNLASQYPEKVQSMAATVDAYYEKTGALRPHANTDYNGCTVGVWAANPNGKASAENGALIMRAEKDQFAAITRVTPSIVGGAVLEFEAKSSKGSPISVQWTSSAQREFSQPQLKPVPLSKDWKKCRIEMPFEGRIDKIRFVLRDADWRADVRNVKLYTPQGTLMTEYEFY